MAPVRRFPRAGRSSLCHRLSQLILSNFSQDVLLEGEDESGSKVLNMPTHTDLFGLDEVPPREGAGGGFQSWPFMLAGAITLLVLGGTVWLWCYLGTTIFFETIRTGLVVCFG